MRKTTRTLGSIAASFLTTVAERQHAGGVECIGIPTGLELVDEVTGGMQPDQVWVVGARTSAGKTALAVSIAMHAALLGQTVVFYSLEMSGEVLVNRILSGMTGISAGRIKRGKIDDDEFRLLQQAASELAQTKFIIVDESLTSEALCEHALRLKDAAINKQSDVHLVIIDNVHIMPDRSPLGSYQKMTDISNRIRNLARPGALNCPILLLAQLNRASDLREDRRPQLSDLKESGSLEQDAEVVLFPFRPFLYERLRGAEPKDVETDAEIIIAKNREGPVMTTRATYYAKLMRWEQKRAAPVEPKSLSER